MRFIFWISMMLMVYIYIYIYRITPGSGIFNFNTLDSGGIHCKNFQCICLVNLVQAFFDKNLNKNYLKNELRMESATYKQVVYSLQYRNTLHAKKHTILFPLRSTNFSSLPNQFDRFSAFRLKRTCKHKCCKSPIKGKQKHVHIFTVSIIGNNQTPENSYTFVFNLLSLLHVLSAHAVHVLIAEQISLFAFWQKGRTK